MEEQGLGEDCINASAWDDVAATAASGTAHSVEASRRTPQFASQRREDLDQKTSSRTQQQTSAVRAHGGQNPEAGTRACCLRVSVVGARNLKHFNFLGDAPWCYCELKRSNAGARPSNFKTVALPNTLNPDWNTTHDFEDWHVGDALEFVVYDQGLVGSKVEGRAQPPLRALPPRRFRRRAPDRWLGGRHVARSRPGRGCGESRLGRRHTAALASPFAGLAGFAWSFEVTSYAGFGLGMLGRLGDTVIPCPR